MDRSRGSGLLVFGVVLGVVGAIMRFAIKVHTSGFNIHTAGVILLIVGLNATNSFSSDVSRFFTGSPTDKAVWMLIGGAVAIGVGLLGMFRGSKPM